MTNMEIGQRFWVIKHSIEFEEVRETSMPRKPYEVILTKVYHSNGCRASAISTTFNQGYDDDDNASAYCSRKDLYSSYEEARIAYNKALDLYLDDLQEQIKHLKTQYLCD